MIKILQRHSSWTQDADSHDPLRNRITILVGGGFGDERPTAVIMSP